MQPSTANAEEKLASSIAGAASEDGVENKDILHLESRFGPISLDVTKSVFFPRGILGFPPELTFGIAEMPIEHLKHFKLLQSLNDQSISFVVLPLDYANPWIEEEDMLAAAALHQIKPEDMVMFLILNVRKMPDKHVITANVRAPLIIDVENRVGGQYVFPHNKYEISQELA